MPNFQDIFETSKWSFISAFSIYMTVALSVTVLNVIISLYFNETKKVKPLIYIAIAIHCWVIKWGEFKSDQKFFAR